MCTCIHVYMYTCIHVYVYMVYRRAARAPICGAGGEAPAAEQSSPGAVRLGALTHTHSHTRTHAHARIHSYTDMSARAATRAYAPAQHANNHTHTPARTRAPAMRAEHRRSSTHELGAHLRRTRLGRTSAPDTTRSHICAGTRPHICAGTRPHICAGTRPTSAPGLAQLRRVGRALRQGHRRHRGHAHPAARRRRVLQSPVEYCPAPQRAA